mgnify:CR=1 FL=1
MLREELMELIEGMDINEQYSIFCEYCEESGYYDDRPESSIDFDELCCGMTPTEILEKYSDIVYCDYFYYDGYGNPTEWDGIETNSSIEEVVDYIIENDEDLYNSDIRDLLDKYMEEEEGC